MAKIEITLKEIVDLIKPKLPNEIQYLNASGNKLKCNIHFDTPFLFPDIDVPFKAEFARFWNNNVYLEWSLDVNDLINKFLNNILAKVVDILSYLGREIEFIDGISRDGDEIKIRLHEVIKGIKISNIQVNNGTVIIEGTQAWPSSGNEPNTKRYAEYWAGGNKIHTFNNWETLKDHYVAIKPIAYHKNYYRFYPSCKNVPIGDINSIADLKKHWEAWSVSSYLLI